MINFLKKIISNKEKIWSFSGGIHPPEMKKQSNCNQLSRLQLPDELIIPVQQHTNTITNIIVKIGDYVLKGQALTKTNGDSPPVHASTSGTITDIISHVVTHPSGLKILYIKLKSDNKDQWCERKILANYLQCSTEILLSHIRQSGIIGLGGAGFPTANKLKNHNKMINTLIINAAECEPYVTADDKLIQEHADEIIDGILILIHILKPKKVLIGIENNKPTAIIAFKKVLLQQQAIIKLKIIPTKYPSGGAKQLVKILTGKEVPHGSHSFSIGILMQNVSTVFAIKRAIINGEPLIERVVTLTGRGIQYPGNYWVRLGTPINFILQQVGLILQSNQTIIIGGPLMGFILHDLTTPILKINNCIFIPTSKEVNKYTVERACINCSFCIQACPMNLLPQQLYLFSKNQKHKKAEEYHLFDCIECGACAYVCPSRIPLIQFFRQEKALIKAFREKKQLIYQIKKRIEAKKARLEQEKSLRQQEYNQSIMKLKMEYETTTKIKNIQTDIQKKKSNNDIKLLNNKSNTKVNYVKENQILGIQVNEILTNQLNRNITTITEQKSVDIRKIVVATAIDRIKLKRNKKVK